MNWMNPGNSSLFQGCHYCLDMRFTGIFTGMEIVEADGTDLHSSVNSKQLGRSTHEIKLQGVERRWPSGHDEQSAHKPATAPWGLTESTLRARLNEASQNSVTRLSFSCSAHWLTAPTSARLHAAQLPLQAHFVTEEVQILCRVSDPRSTNRIWFQWPLVALHSQSPWKKSEGGADLSCCWYVCMPTPPGPGIRAAPCLLQLVSSI
jgi:hypothetical protein